MNLALCVLDIVGSSPTRGFPNLEEVQGNGSLLSKYSTHDGELRSVPSGQSNCSTGQGSITEIAFIALPGVGYDSIELVINSSNSVVSTVNLSGAIQSFGTFGYELVLPEANRIAFNSGDVLWLYLPYHNESRLRLLYQTVPVPLNTCWRYIEEVSGDIKCGDYHDYPLLAFETGNIIIMYVHAWI